MNAPPDPSQAECDPQRLDRYLSGQLEPAEATITEHHLTQCETCRVSLERCAADGDFWDQAAEFLDQRSEIDRAKFTLEFLSGDSLATGAVEHDTERYLDRWLTATGEPSELHGLGALGRYEILEVIGVGGMGIVLRAYDQKLKREVAIKTLREYLSGSEEAIDRFAREAQIAASLRDRHVVPIYNVDSWQHVPYFVMPFIEHGSLSQFVQDRPAFQFSIDEILQVAHQVACGLAVAHRDEMVHRDIKPSNILLFEGLEHVVISDFGLARTLDASQLTLSSALAGTPQFMSPEQARGETIDTRSDIFSLGSLLYWLCTFESPFAAETSFGTLSKIVHDPYRPVRELRPDLPWWMERFIAQLLVKDRDGRELSASDCARILEGLQNHLKFPSQHGLPAEIRSTQGAWRPMLTICGTVACLIAVLTGITFFPSWRSGTKELGSAETAVSNMGSQVAMDSEQNSPQAEAKIQADDEQRSETLARTGPLDELDRVNLFADLQSGKRLVYWLDRLSGLETHEIPHEAINIVASEYSQHESQAVRDLAESLLSRNPFETVGEDDANPFVIVE